MARIKFTRTEIAWTQAFAFVVACAAVAVLSLALPACNSSGGSSGDSSSASSGGSGSGGTQQQLSPAQQQFQNVVSQYNALPNYSLSAADVQTLSSQGLLQGNDQNALTSFASSN